MSKLTMEDLLKKREGVNRNEVIESVKSWIGTPYMHKQRCKGVGADCIQFLIGVAEDLKIFPEWINEEIGITQYSTQWHLHKNEELLIKYVEMLGLIEKNKFSYKLGDVLGFKFCNVTAHLGIVYTKDTMVHAQIAYPSKVAEVRITPAWSYRITKCWEIPNIK